MATSLTSCAAPRDVGLSPERADKLVARLRRMVEKGELPSGQLAVARRGAVAVAATFGTVECGGQPARADGETLYAAFSTTKALTAAAVWLLFQDGKLGCDDRVADWIPGFEANGKGEVRVEHLLTHTAGFPRAPFDTLDWNDGQRRLERFASWRLDWAPGERFEYHPTSSMWVLAELIERAAGCDFRDFVRRRIAEPLGLAELFLGLPASLNGRVADVVPVGTAASPDTLRDAELALPDRFVGTGDSMLLMNRPEHRAVGAPGGGLVTNAGSLALFYQALLGDLAGEGGPGVWQSETLRVALRVRTGRMKDPMTGRLALRALGVVVAGGEHRTFRSFAPENSPEAFGHAGAGGQIAWGDPATGLSFAFLTNGFDRNPLAMGGRGIALAHGATRCLPAAGSGEQARRER